MSELQEFSFIGAFLVGLATSMHCVGMCGGIVTAFFIRIGNRGGILPYINYHAGRIMVYTLLGTAIAALSISIDKQSPDIVRYRSLANIVVGVIIILIGLDMLKVLPLRLPLEKIPAKRLRRLYQGATNRGPLLGPFLGGVINGFIPCGPLYAVLFLAVDAGNPASGGLLLALFGLGTLPAMLFVSFFVGKVGARARGIVFAFAAIMVIFLGMWLVATSYSKYNKVNADPNVTCH